MVLLVIEVGCSESDMSELLLTNPGDIIDAIKIEGASFNSDSYENDYLYLRIAEEHEIEDTYSDPSESADFGPRELYDGACSTIVEKLLTKCASSFNQAIFVPISIYEGFKLEILDRGIPIAAEHEWDYDLQIGDKIHSMKLIWILPDYLRYMDKPFWNPDAITQVNLVLDYHRTQKRRRGIEIFTIFDLISFKMAIDDNRYEYENCEFHKIIDRTLGEIIQSGMYVREDKFYLKGYLSDRQDYRKQRHEIIDYLVYHFQKTVDSMYWNDFDPYPIKLSNITDISTFLEFCLVQHTPTMLVRETDYDGKCSEVLYEILSKTKKKIKFVFVLDGEWIYSGHGFLLNELAEPLANCDLTIFTKNSFNFIENFINWLKFAFGKRSKYFDLQIVHLETINPYVFTGFHITRLEILDATLDHKLIRMLKKCKHSLIHISNCRIANDFNERFEFIQQRSARDGQNIFKFLDELDNVGDIELVLEAHTIGTLFAYVASVMVPNKLTEFEFKNKMVFEPWRHDLSRFHRSDENEDFDVIEACTSSGDTFDVYELCNDLKPSDRESFDFYE